MWIFGNLFPGSDPQKWKNLKIKFFQDNFFHGGVVGVLIFIIKELTVLNIISEFC